MWVDQLKIAEQTSHLYGSSPLCNLEWLFMSTDCRTVAEQTSHVYGFSPVWLLKGYSTGVFVLDNEAEQTSHLYGFSPLCTFKCFRKSSDCISVAEQTSHVYGFSPLCSLECALRVLYGEM